MLNANHKPLTTLPAGECSFVRLVKNYSEMKVIVFAIRKRGPSLCYSWTDYSDDTKSGFEPDRFRKMKRFDNAMQSLIVKSIAAGYCFHVEPPLHHGPICLCV